MKKIIRIKFKDKTLSDSYRLDPWFKNFERKRKLRGKYGYNWNPNGPRTGLK